MSRLSQWSFRGFNLNQEGARVRKMTGPFSLPPLRGTNFLTPGRTGQLFTTKVHDQRKISLEIVVFEDGVRGVGGAQGFFDQLAVLFANRAQGSLAYTDLTGYTRTGQAECISWTPADQSVVGLVYAGIADFLLADPWMYGTIVTGNVVPNAGLAFGTPVVSNISGPRTTWTAAMSGTVSGQPIIVVHATQSYTTVLTSIADTFGTPYTWTKVDGNNTSPQDLEIYIGTGGVGTSGTVTVTAPSGLIGGAAIPMTGASTSAGLGAIDVHGNGTGATPTMPTLSLTPAASWGGALFTAISKDSTFPYLFSPTPALYGYVPYLGVQVNPYAGFLYPTSGVAFTPIWGFSGTAGWNIVGCVIKGSGAAVTLNITNTGTATAEKLTLDFLGPIANPTITNMTNGTSVTVNTMVGSTKHLIVDTGAYTALNDGANVIGSVAHSGAAPFLTLNPGANALQVSGAACTGSTLVTCSFAPPFV